MVQRFSSVAELRKDPRDVAVPVAVIVFQQLIGGHMAGLDAFLQGIQEVGFIGHQAACAGPRARFQARLGNGDRLARQRMHVDAIHLGMKPIHRGCHAHCVARFRVEALHQIPGRVQCRLIVEQADPEGGQGAQAPPRAAICATHFDEFLDPGLGEHRGQMVGPIRQRRRLAGQRGQLSLQEIAEALAKRIDIGPVAIDEIHRHIERVVHPSFEPEAVLENEGQHPGAGIVQGPPDTAAPRLVAVHFAFEEGRVGKKGRRDRLQSQRHAQFLHHVGLGPEIEVHLHGAGAAHHGRAHGADLLHVAVHQLVTPLGHQRHVLMRPARGRAKTDEAHADPVGDVLHVAQVVVHLVTGLVDGFQRRARQFQLATGFEADIGAVLGQADEIAALDQRVPAMPVAQPLQHRENGPVARIKIPKIKSVEGRFERVGRIKNNSKVILDYAHTPDALKTCLQNIKEQLPGKKIALVFGCGGNRDQNKRAKMGKIADLFSDKIYLTDDNPRLEQPSKIRKDITKGIKKQKILEFSNQAKAIAEAIKNLNTGEILLVAGKGHEKIQEIGVKKIFFSDKKIILDAIKIKNLKLSNNLKVNILNELSAGKKISNQIFLEKARINSKEIKKNDIFFAIKGKKNDGNKFISEAFKKKASVAVVNKIEKKLNISRQIKSKDSLKLLTESSELYRENIKTKIIAITGSCGKTTLKELLGNTLKQISTVGISPKSYNNKYGVPLSLFNLDQRNDYGVLEIGMDKKGEIDFLSKIVKPDVSVITNINYAHAKNFKNIKQIALAKSEIINNTKINGSVVLNADDNFYTLHKKIANKRKLKILSFSIDNQNANIKLVSIKKITNKFKATIRVNNLKTYFFISNSFQNNILNILAALAVISVFIDVSKLKKNIFMGFKTPDGRGDIAKIEINNKRLNLVDESYNSNPLSLKSAILNFDKIKINKGKKYLLLGDMLELGKHSKKLHQTIGKIINKTKIDKIFVKGDKILFTYNSILKKKKGRVLNNNSQIIDLIKNDLNNNDYLMVKASNATGFHKIISQIKG